MVSENSQIQLLIVALTLLVSFLTSFVFTKWWIKIARTNKLEGKDMNKFSKPIVAEGGGIAFASSVVFSSFIYLFLQTFIAKDVTKSLEIIILIGILVSACAIGFLDDILGWKKGLKSWKRILMTIPLSVPIMILARDRLITFPFFGLVDFGILFPLVIIPLGIIGATNGYNLLAGYNGLESGLGVVIFSTFGIASFLKGNYWIASLAGLIVFSLIGFYIFNRFPAKVFPGDSLTYSLGVLIAFFAVAGKMEELALLMFIPFIIEGFLKLRSNFKAENFGIPGSDGSLETPYKKNYSLTHISIRILKKINSGKAYEKSVSRLLISFEIVLGIIGIIYLGI